MDLIFFFVLLLSMIIDCGFHINREFRINDLGCTLYVHTNGVYLSFKT